MRKILLAITLGAAAIAAVFAAPPTAPSPGLNERELLRNINQLLYDQAGASGSSASTTITTSQATLSTTASLVVAANTARHSIVIDNHDAAINVFLGPVGVTTANGKLLRPGQALTFSTKAAIYAVAASGAPVLSTLSEND